MSGDAKPINNADKKPIYKKWWFWAIIAFLLICIGAAASSNDNSDQQQEGTTSSKESSKDEELKKAKLSPKKVNNDVTGNWRISTTAEPIDMRKYALAFYKEYFKDDNEIHAIVNFTNKTTTKISKTPMGINVTVHEYVDKEEHDAKKLFSGKTLSDTYYDSQTGEEIKLGE